MKVLFDEWENSQIKPICSVFNVSKNNTYLILLLETQIRIIMRKINIIMRNIYIILSLLYISVRMRMLAPHMCMV